MGMRALKFASKAVRVREKIAKIASKCRNKKVERKACINEINAISMKSKGIIKMVTGLKLTVEVDLFYC